MKAVSLLLATIILIFVIGCSGFTRTECPASKAIVRQVSESSQKAEITITDEKILSELIKFFGDLENEPITQINGKWKEKYRIAFIMKSGMHIIVITSEDDATWTSGSGDKQMVKGVSSLLEPLFHIAAPANTNKTDAA
ncbi:MAG: hypothetical protein JXN60_07700 [Lentisphaerae bacterium]|nr:hypothetical protein [Lentisphaerota bacterium]